MGWQAGCNIRASNAETLSRDLYGARYMARYKKKSAMQNQIKAQMTITSDECELSFEGEPEW